MIDETNITSIDETTESTTPQAPKKSGKTKYCEKCRKSYDAINKVCPYCGHKNKYTALKVGIGVMVGGTILFGAIPDLAKDKDDDSSSTVDRAIVTETDTSIENTTEIEITTSEAITTTNQIIKTTTTDATTTTERKLLVFTKSKESDTLHIDPYCGAVENILPENKETIEIYEDELEQYADQYRACGRCSRRYSDKLSSDSE